MTSYKDMSTKELNDLKNTLASLTIVNPNAAEMVKTIEKEIKRRKK